jgi:hypothetical protein
METRSTYDFGLRTAPDHWQEAALEAPEGDPTPLRRKRHVGTLPVSNQMDFVTSFLAALCMAAVCGTAWYLIETNHAVRYPWLAVALGALLAVAVRLGGGRDHAETRAVMSVVFYLATLLIVAYLVERWYHIALWGPGSTLVGGERGLVRHRLTEPVTLAAWCLGLVATVQLSYLLRRR